MRLAGLSLVLLCAIDPVAWVRHYLGVEPSPAQAEILRSNAHRAVVNCTRGFGKSTVLAWKAAHKLATTPGALVLAISPSGRQSGELLAKVRASLAKAGHPTKGDGINEYSCKLANGARFVALPGTADTIRGFHGVALLLIEEAAFVPDATYEAARAFLAVGGGAEWMASTPYGPMGFFYRRCTEPELGYKVWEVTWRDVPWITLAFIEEERKAKGERLFAQEYECRFLDPSDSCFSRERLLAAITPEVEALVIP